jgi:serine/threonine-protein kinase RsbW
MTIAYIQGGPCIDLERCLPSGVAAISPFVDRLMLLFRRCGCVSEGESEVEIALREALANAIIHGNHENPQKRVHVRCRCKSDEVSNAVKDEGRGFDVHKIADPTAPENTGSVHGRGIYLMKALMDEVRFEEGGVVVHMRKSTAKLQPTMHRKTRWSRSVSDCDSKSISRASAEKIHACNTDVVRKQWGFQWGFDGVMMSD